MNPYRKLMLTCSLLLFCLCLSVPAFAVDNLKEFFAPATGTVIMPVDDKYLIDLDAADKINQGDLLTIIYEGEKIIHPTTGEILGTLNDYGPTLQVTEIKSGYSYAKVVSEQASVKRGDRVSRFENIPVYFLDESGEDSALFSKLKRELPQLNWSGYLPATANDFFNQQPLLVIKKLNDNLVLIDQTSSVIQSFTVPDPTSSGTVSPTETETLKPGAPTILPSAKLPPQPAFGQPKGGLFAPPPQYQSPKNAEKLAGVIRGSRFNDEIFAIKFGDFSGTGLQQAVVALSDKVLLGIFSGGDFVAKSEYKLSGHQQILKFSKLDIDADGKVEILATGTNGLEIDSIIFEVNDDKLSVHSRHSWIFNVLNAQSGKPILIGQKKEGLLSYPPLSWQLQLSGKTFRASPYELSPRYQLYGTSTLATQSGEHLTITLSENDNLKAVRSGKILAWESETKYGGLESKIQYLEENAYQDNDPRYYFLKANLVTTERNSILTTRHEGKSVVMKDSPNLGAGRIVELYWNGFSLEEAGSTPNLGGYIPDFDLVDIDGDGDQDVVAAVVYTKKGLFKKPVSGIVVIANER